MNPPVPCLSRTLSISPVQSSGVPPTTPSCGRSWHGCAVRMTPLGGGGRGLTFGLEAVPCDSRPIHGTLSSAIRGMTRKSSAAFFTERTLAAYLAVSDRTIRNWIRRGELPSYKLGSSRRIDPADVEDFLVRHRDEAA